MSKASRDLERWLPIPGYENLYEISDHGRCRSLARLIPHSRGGFSQHAERIIKGSVGKNGRLRYRLSRDGKFERIQAHRAVLLAFVGPAPEGMVGCHKDDVPLNNHLSNLRWDTPSANSYDAIRNGVHPKAAVTHCSRGHRYLPESTLRHKSRRCCRACVRASSAIARRRRKGLPPIAPIQQLSDWAYADILAGIDRRHRDAQEDYWGTFGADAATQRRPAAWAATPTCPHGHEWTEENTKFTGGTRTCRTCVRLRARARRAAQRKGVPYVDPFQERRAS